MTTMRVAIIGRTEMLLAAADRAREVGHTIGLVATCRASGHEQAQESEFAALARNCRTPFLEGRAICSPEGLHAIRAAACDIAISMNWLHVLPRSVRSLFPLGIFNAHPGDLPRYRGNACPNWAILQGEKQVVLTVHQMDDGLDTGPVALKRAFSLEPDRDIGDVYTWLRTAVPEAFRDLLSEAGAGRLRLEPQSADPTAALRCYPRRPSDACIAWAKPADEIVRLVRASGRPFDGAFTRLESEHVLRVWSASRLAAPEPFLAVPGQVAFAVDGDPVIAAGDGFVRLLDVTLDGGTDGQAARQLILKSMRNRLT